MPKINIIYHIYPFQNAVIPFEDDKLFTLLNFNVNNIGLVQKLSENLCSEKTGNCMLCGVFYSPSRWGLMHRIIGRIFKVRSTLTERY